MIKINIRVSDLEEALEVLKWAKKERINQVLRDTKININVRNARVGETEKDFMHSTCESAERLFLTAQSSR